MKEREMNRKEIRAILNGVGIQNEFSLRTVGLSDLTRKVVQCVTIKGWEPNRSKYDAVEGAFRGTGVIVDFE